MRSIRINWTTSLRPASGRCFIWVTFSDCCNSKPMADLRVGGRCCCGRHLQLRTLDCADDRIRMFPREWKPGVGRLWSYCRRPKWSSISLSTRARCRRLLRHEKFSEEKLDHQSPLTRQEFCAMHLLLLAPRWPVGPGVPLAPLVIFMIVRGLRGSSLRGSEGFALAPDADPVYSKFTLQVRHQGVGIIFDHLQLNQYATSDGRPRESARRSRNALSGHGMSAKSIGGHHPSSISTAIPRARTSRPRQTGSSSVLAWASCLFRRSRTETVTS